MSGGTRGILKNLSALFSSHVIAVLQQVALVPLFLLRYGRAGYGEWLAISAAVSYLGTLDFGVQTFVNQDLTVRYHSGQMETLHRTQSTALRMLLGIVGVAAAGSAVLFVLPLQHWLRMDGSHGNPVVSARIVQTAVFCMAMQALLNIVYGYFSGTFMVVGRAHVGAYWGNTKNLSLIISALLAAWFGSNFAVVAGAQVAAMLLCLLAMTAHLRVAAPQIFPTLAYWDRELAGKILRPSGYFALIYSSNFLVYQLPILILQRTVGATAVALFSVMRTIFSMTRNLLNALTQAIGPEVTTLYARKDWPALGRLYETSERIIFAVIPVANISVLCLSPFLLTIWLKQPGLFDARLYLLSATISIVMSTKEHKFQFQFSTNTHRELARFMFGSYVFLGVCWIFLAQRFGVLAILVAWLVVETAQTAYLVRLNGDFFRHYGKLDRRYLMRLATMSVLGAAAAGSVLSALPGWRLCWQVGFATAIAVTLGGIAYGLFGLRPLAGELTRRYKWKN